MNKIYSIDTQRKYMIKNGTTLTTELVEAHGKIRLYMVKRSVSLILKFYLEKSNLRNTHSSMEGDV